MLGFLFMMMFMIPLCFLNCMVVFQYTLFFIIIFLYFNNSFNFFSGVSYYLGLDFFSYGLVILTIFITCLMYLCSLFLLFSSSCIFMVFFSLLLCMLLCLVFCVLNFFLLYIFFEFSLIPLFLMIVGWGYQPERLISSIYLFFYTLVASLPLFFYLIYMYMFSGSLFFDYFYGVSNSFLTHIVLMLAFLVSFPMFMFHFWLPKAHVYSPVFGSMILAGLLLKIGGYGLIRFMYVYELLFLKYSYIWFSLSIMGSIIVSLICFSQGDIKCLVAYSSVAHMGLCLMGLLTMSKFGLMGSYFMMISHGLCSSGLFCLSNFYYDRLHSRSFFLNKGLIYFMPSMSLFMFMFCSFNMGCPPSLNFLSEVMILVSVISYWFSSMYYMVFMSLFGALFSVYLFSYSQHGLFHSIYSFSFMNAREYLLIYCHFYPIIFLLFVVDLFY
uniref:NADH dehydrogenase subunit 4 n=1 Tax=Nandigallia matai TaxID=1792639 RepID=UPI003003218B|nr:NADH dehydrogenase subunit 4 [Nandigallia matai]